MRGRTNRDRRILKTNLTSAALSYYGTSEIAGDTHNPLIVKWNNAIMPWVKNDEVPWCSSFMNIIAEQAGLETTGKPNALSWLDVGVDVSAAAADPSDTIVVFDWRNGGRGHVGVYVRHDDNYVWVLGGNQGNKVKISMYRRHGADRVVYFRRLRPE